jgi:two-component system OmpR family sensor kinase
MRSLRLRLTMALSIATTVVILVFALVATVLVSQFLQNRAEEALTGAADRTTAGLTAAGGATMTQPDLVSFAAQSPAPWSVHGVLLVNRAGAVAATGIDDDRVAALAAVTSDQPVDVADDLALRIDVDGLGLRYDTGSATVPVDGVILVASTEDQGTTVGFVVVAMLVGAAISIALLIAIAVAIVGHGLRPLRAMADRAEAVVDGDRTARLPTQGVGDPAIERVSRAVNAALDAQQDAENRVRAFVADASHELRSPVTAAAGWIDLYLQGGLDEPTRLDHAMGRTAEQIARMRALVDELATLARTDAGLPLAFESVDLTWLATAAVDDARVVAPGRDLRLVAPGPAPLLGDPARLSQVLRNLVGNAVQHTPDDAAVTVAIEPGERRHTVTVADTGPGITPADLPHIFERFWRSDPSRTRHTGGSGLGLSIVQSLVRSHDGDITVTSSADAGTAFIVTLPAAWPS